MCCTRRPSTRLTQHETRRSQKEAVVKNMLTTCVAATSLFATLAVPVRLAAQDQQQQNAKRPRYTVTDLGPAQSFAEGINNKGWVDGTAILPDGVDQHAFLWRNGKKTDLGTL